jgi:hypothetical protein
MNLTQQPISELIRLLPVRQHSTRVSRAVWEPRFAAAALTPEFETIFGGELEVSLSRQQIRRQADLRRKCLEVLLWGYPSGMRGNRHECYLANVDAISEHAARNDPWPEYFSNLHAVRDLGISTITKLAYFFGKTFDGHPAVILDSQIITVFSRATWEEFAGLHHLTYNNASNNYVRYLQAIDSVVRSIPGATSDQIEFFLFSLGDAFAVTYEANHNE